MLTAVPNICTRLARIAIHVSASFIPSARAAASPVHVCLHIYVCVNVYVHVKYMYMYTYMHMYMHMYMYMHIYRCTCLCLGIFVSVRQTKIKMVCTYICIQLHKYVSNPCMGM